MAKRLKPGARKAAPDTTKAKDTKKKKDTTPPAQAAAAPTAGHNSTVTREMTKKAHEELNKLEGALETAKGRLQQKWKDLKEQGHDTAALKRARKDLREDPLEQQLTFEHYNLYREYLGVQDGVEQQRQENERAANSASVDAAERTKGGRGPTFSLADVKRLPATHHLRGVYAAGLRAGLEGEKCEHSYEEGTDAAHTFEGAHKEGLEQRATVARMAPKNGASAHA